MLSDALGNDVLLTMWASLSPEKPTREMNHHRHLTVIITLQARPLNTATLRVRAATRGFAGNTTRSVTEDTPETFPEPIIKTLQKGGDIPGTTLFEVVP